MTAVKTFNDSDFSHNYRSLLEPPKGHPLYRTGTAFNWDWFVVVIIR